MPVLRTIAGQVEDGCPGLRDESVDLTFTSPPYFKVDGWTPALMRALGRLLGRVSKPGARSFVVFGQMAEGMARPRESAGLIVEGAAGALVEWQTIIWVKSYADGGPTTGHFTPLDNSPNLLNYSWEYVFQFVKGDPRAAPPLDKLSAPLGVPYADKSNLTRGNRGKNGDVHCGGDVWVVKYETTGKTEKKAHRHSFPIGLATRGIVASGITSGAVFDPFSGGGTTSVAAAARGLDAVALDRDPEALEVTRSRWVEAGGTLSGIVQKTPDVFVVA